METPVAIYRDRLRRFILRRVPDPSDADDILQDVMIRMHNGIGGVRDGERIESWAYQITRNAIIDRHRVAAKRPEMTDLEEALDVPEALDSEAAHKEAAECMRPMIELLPEHYRDAVMMSEIEGVTQREVADRLGISLSGAKSRVQRGREKLRQMLLECCSIERGICGTVTEMTPRKPGPTPCSD